MSGYLYSKFFVFFCLLLMLSGAAGFGEEAQPAKFFDAPYRIVGGKPRDFRAIIDWANEYQYLNEHRPSLQDDGTLIQSDIPDWQMRWQQLAPATTQWESFLVVGRIAKIDSSGMLVDCGREKKLLKNYPQQKKLQVDDFIECLAIPIGSTQYRLQSGEEIIAAVLDYGKPLQIGDLIQMEQLLAAEASGEKEILIPEQTQMVKLEKTETPEKPGKDSSPELVPLPPPPEPSIAVPASPPPSVPAAPPIPPPSIQVSEKVELPPSSIETTEAAPQRIRGPVQRTVNGKTIEFGPIMEWANEYQFLRQRQPIVDNDGTFVESDLKDWNKRWLNIQDNTKRWQDYLVVGRVVQVLPGGLIIDTGQQQLFLKNHPQQNQLTQDNYVECVAVPSGAIAIKDSHGIAENFALFDYGTFKLSEGIVLTESGRPSRAGLKAPGIFNDMPFRSINGVIHDFRPVMKWANERQFLAVHRPQQQDDGTLRDSELSDWGIRWQAVQDHAILWDSWVVAGHVDAVLPEGILVNCGKEMKLVRNFSQPVVLKQSIYCVGQPKGVFKRTSNNGENLAASIVDHGLPASFGPNRYLGLAYRLVRGRVYDFSSIINWANEFKYLSECRSLKIEEFPTGAMPSINWDARWKKVADGQIKWRDFLISGKVVETLEDGLIVECDEQTKLVRNHPRQTMLAKGDPVDCIAVPIGVQSYRSESGSRIKIPAYDHGQPLQP
ncbi:MAG: hypothetical protein PHV34_01935 [Verrucomicrobiae bacterium]|nr:hypothetical protein [Verrucomicrobiae bacterium]